MSAEARIEHFPVGETYEVEAHGHIFPLTLESAVELPRSVRENGAFQLHFRGPANPIFPQGIYPMRLGETCWELFIVPLGPEKDGNGAGYEVIFN